LKCTACISLEIPLSIIREGKPENQNHAIIFTRGEYIQTIDMNQEMYFEETLQNEEQSAGVFEIAESSPHDNFGLLGTYFYW
jgi:callose synthase